MLAFLFPGQGMEEPRMGLGLAERSAVARGLLERASAVAGLDLFRLLERGGRDLGRTEVLQVALTAVSLGVAAELGAAGIAPQAVAGHSLGEIAAWSAAGGVAPLEAVELAGLRGRLMGREAARHPGGLLALLGGRELAEEALRLGSGQGAVEIAAHNGPAEWVLSGERPALREIAAAFPSRMLAVAGAWHGRAMAGAVEELRKALSAASRNGAPLGAAFFSNRTGEAAEPQAIPHWLAEQLVRPVKWARTIEGLAAAGATAFVTVGPGRVLRGLLRQNLGDVPVHSTEDPSDLDRTIAALEGREA